MSVKPLLMGSYCCPIATRNDDSNEIRGAIMAATIKLTST